jgi:hypothetical protein
MFQIADYEFLTVYTNMNLTEQTPVNSRHDREVISSFDTIEWICMKIILLDIFENIVFFVFF